MRYRASISWGLLKALVFDSVYGWGRQVAHVIFAEARTLTAERWPTFCPETSRPVAPTTSCLKMDVPCSTSLSQSPSSTSDLVTTMAYRQSPHSATLVTTFLSLPLTLRRRIYSLTGLVRVCPIDLNREGQGKDQYLQICLATLRRTFADWDQHMEQRRSKSPREQIADMCCFYRNKRSGGKANFPGPGGVDCVCGPLPIGLLLVSSAIYSEVMTMFYSENRFKICLTAPGGLTALFRMSPAALQAMTCLHVRLNNCGCVPGHVCSLDNRPRSQPFFFSCPSCHRSCKCGTELPLSSQDAELGPLLLEWQNLTTHLARHLRSYQLRLSVVCDTLDQQVARQIVQPLQELPLLTGCAIRLGQSPNPRLRLLAETATRQAMGQPPIPSTIFPWQDLPSEIQLRVLSYSDLVAPRLVEWEEGWGLGRSACCQQCTDSLETCCCPSLHAAFSSLGCRCWQWPSELFLVNKTWREQALRIAYSSNSFSVSRPRHRASDETEHRSALTFLQSIPRDALPHIRSLRIVFGLCQDNHLSPNTHSLTNWVTTLAFIQKNLALAQLHLTVCAETALENYPYGDGTWIDAEDIEWKFYQRLTAPMVVLRGLGSLRTPFPPPPKDWAAGPPYLDRARAARNLAQQRQLQIQILGPVDQAFSTATTGRTQGHPRL